MVAKHAGHIGGRFQAAPGIGQGMAANFINGAAKAHAGEHIGQLAAAGAVHERIADGNHGEAGALGKLGEAGETGLVLAIIARGGAKKGGAGIAAR